MLLDGFLLEYVGEAGTRMRYGPVLITYFYHHEEVATKLVERRVVSQIAHTERLVGSGDNHC